MAAGVLESLTGTYHIPSRDLMTEGLIGFHSKEMDCVLTHGTRGLEIKSGNKRLTTLPEEEVTRLLRDRERVPGYVIELLSKGYNGLLARFFTLASGNDQLSIVRQQIGLFEPYIYPEEIFIGKVKEIDGKKVKVQLERKLDLLDRDADKILTNEDSLDSENFERNGIPVRADTAVYFTPLYVKGVEFNPVLFWPETSLHLRA